MPGMHGPAHVNKAIGLSDLIIGVGLRFDDRVTGKVDGFAPNARFIHIDIDPSEMHKVKVAALPIVSDAKLALAALAETVEPSTKDAWLNEVRSWQAEDEARQQQIQRDDVLPDPIGILAAIREATHGEAIVVSDVGQNQMWTARHYTWTRPIAISPPAAWGRWALLFLLLWASRPVCPMHPSGPWLAMVASR